MNTVFRMAAAFAAGAFAMYYFDPITGRRRRAMLRDQRIAAVHDIEDMARARSKHAADHLRGMAARTRAELSSEEIDDQRLQERIRAKLGHVVQHPNRVEVQVHDGNVVLTGQASGQEIEEVLMTLTAMKGVVDVDNRLSVPESAASTAGEPRH